ncbi:hypothetical protein Q8A73_003374 [Channa argus]|nr:hypothetical protein Q8A73_003374 [Channa argus]
MERVGVDILGPFPTTEAGNRYILVAMDYFTKWPEAYAVPDQTATTAAQRLVEDMFSRFGVPEELHSDQGRNFESRLFAEVCQRLGVRKTRTTPLHPQSDGLVERFNRTLATQLAILTSQHQKDWDQHLPLVLWAYRTAVQESSQCTPATLMFGRELRTPVDLVFGPPPEPEITGGPELDYLRRLKERLSVVHQLARGDAGARQKRAYDGRCHGHPFAVGDNVWVYCPVRKRGLSPKLTSHWQGPGEILDRISEVVYRVRMPGRGRRVVLHRDRLAPYHPLAPNPVTEPEDSLLSATPSASMNNGGLGAEPGTVSGPLQRPAHARRLPGQPIRDSSTTRASAPQQPHRDHRSPAQAGQERQRRRRGSCTTRASAPQPPHRDHRSPAQAGQEGQRRHRGNRTARASVPQQPPPRAYAPPSDETAAAVAELAQRSGGHLDAAQRQQLNRLLQDFVDIFAARDEDCTRTGLVQHHIDTGDAPPIRLRPHRLPLVKRQAAQELIESMVANDIIEPSDSPWAAPMVMVRKKNGKMAPLCGL